VYDWKDDVVGTIESNLLEQTELVAQEASSKEDFLRHVVFNTFSSRSSGTGGVSREENDTT
jgi:hypothetical protein